MFGSLGGPEILLLLVLALRLFGPRKLPEIGRTLGKSLSEFRRATTEFKTTLKREVELDQVQELGAGLGRAKSEIQQSMDEVGRLSVPRGVLPSADNPRGGEAGGDASDASRDSAPTSPPADDGPKKES